MNKPINKNKYKYQKNTYFMKIYFDNSENPSKKDESLYEKIEREIISKWGTKTESSLDADLIITDFTKANASKGYQVGILEREPHKKVILFYRNLKDNDPHNYIPEYSPISVLEVTAQKKLLENINSEIREYVLGIMKKTMRLWMYM
jgi:hypothetical protein